MVQIFLLAYDVLSDEKKRRLYDQHGTDGLRDQPGFEGGHFQFDFSDFFKDFSFGQRGSSNKGGSRFSFFDDDDDDHDMFHRHSGDFGSDMFSGFGSGSPFGSFGGFGDFGNFGFDGVGQPSDDESFFSHSSPNQGKMAACVFVIILWALV